MLQACELVVQGRTGSISISRIRIQKVDEPPAYKTKTKTKPRPRQDEDSPPSQHEHVSRDIDIGVVEQIGAARHRTPRQEGRTDGIPCAPAPARGVRRMRDKYYREWEKRSSKEKSRRTDGDGKRALVPGPWHSAPNPTGTPAPAKFKLRKQPVWTAYASPNVAERGRKELQNNARTTAVGRARALGAPNERGGLKYKYNQREQRVVEEPRGQWKRKGGQGVTRVEWIKSGGAQVKRAAGSAHPCLRSSTLGYVGQNKPTCVEVGRQGDISTALSTLVLALLPVDTTHLGLLQLEIGLDFAISQLRRSASHYARLHWPTSVDEHRHTKNM
ncbi:hypothetical protein B0H13DRAFT_1902694 [Mycena leptocephala]|nr:hypothetical protein B0H13DRAFT_1902694 [Mycena leptocephala]